MFKNLLAYRIKPMELAPSAVEEVLAKNVFTQPLATEPHSCGWIPPRADHGPLVEQINGHMLMRLKLAQRKVPSQELQRRVEAMAEQIEEQTGRKPGKKAIKDLKEQALHELLPLAFITESAITVWIAPEQNLLMIDSGSPSRAEEVVSLLTKTIDGLALHLIQTAEAPATCMAAWLMDGDAPEGFTIDRECELKSEDEMKSVVRYARHALDIDEVRQHLEAGKRPTRLAMSYKDRVSFQVTDTLQLKKIEFLDLVFEGRDANEDQFDADAAITTGELIEVVASLIDGMGGEHDFLAGLEAANTVADTLEAK